MLQQLLNAKFDFQKPLKLRTNLCPLALELCCLRQIDKLKSGCCIHWTSIRHHFCIWTIAATWSPALLLCPAGTARWWRRAAGNRAESAPFVL